MTDKPTADDELLRLREDIDQLQSIVASLLEKAQPDAMGDDMSAMAFCFVNKQMEHIKSICLLADNHQYRDAWAISRMMFEGLALLRWANLDPIRAEDWKSYWYIGDYRHWHGRSGYLAKKEVIENHLEIYAIDSSLSKGKKKNRSEITPNDYYKSWCLKRVPGKDPAPTSPKDIIKDWVRRAILIKGCEEVEDHVKMRNGRQYPSI